jgi:glycine/D-amino acid oxidase-like deaminating enzyme
MTSDVLIVGGGVVGSSVAWHLREHGFMGRIVVVERDRSYLRASSFLAMGGIRQQFCTAVTVRMVQHSVGFWKQFDARMGTPDARPRAWFRQRGYLFLADASTAPALMQRYEQERRAGAVVQMLAPDDIARIVPDAWLDDIVFGVLGPDDGYANPREVLSGFTRGGGRGWIRGRRGHLHSRGERTREGRDPCPR